MADQPYNEPAFPVQDLSKTQFAGMTLRDYFATHIVIQEIDNYSIGLGTALLGSAPPTDRQQNLLWWARYRAAIRYIEADAMLEGRAA